MTLAFGPYVVEAELGRGGAGVVYRARDAAGAVVAVKVLVAGPGADARAARRLAREARLLERLRHPAIVPVRAVGEARGGLWLAMDLVDGQTLQARLAVGGPLPPRAAAALMAEVARGVAHAHAQGVLHRDIKPDNVLLDRAGRPFLTDFGLAKDLEGTLHGASLSVSGQFLGTPGYWAPEQARGERGQVGPATDVYGLGATLFAALTGGPPFAAASLVEALQNAERAPPPASRANPAVPAALDAVCARAMRLAPEERFAGAEDLARALEAFLADGRRPRGRRRRRRWPLVVGGATVVGLLGAALGWALRSTPIPPGSAAATPDLAATSAEPPAAPEPAEPPPPLDPAEVLAAAATLSREGRDGDAVRRLRDLLRTGVALDAEQGRQAVQIVLRAVPGSGASFLTPRAPVEHLEAAAEVLEALVDRTTSDVVRVLAGQTLARALHGRVDPARVERALASRSDLVLAELRLAEGRLDEAERLLEGRDASPPMNLLRAVLRIERAVAAGRREEALEAAHRGLQSARLADGWSLSILDHLRARRALGLGLPPAHEDRALTDDEVTRLLQVRRELETRDRLETFIDLCLALPPAARRQVAVQQSEAATRVVRCKALLAAGDEAGAREHRERAQALVTPPRDGIDHMILGDLLASEDRWAEALRAYGETAREAPRAALVVRDRSINVVVRLHPELESCFLAPPGGSPAAREQLALLRLLCPADEAPSRERTVALEVRARLAYLAGEVDEADAVLARALTEEPDALGVLLSALERHLQAVRLADARAVLERLPGEALGAIPHVAALARLLEAEEAAAKGDGPAARTRAAALLADVEAAERPLPLALRARVRRLVERLGD
ncbi:MAG: protein kinase [Planctomycetes bacterium]|nr:protein kinase [Planctomycetota bacterium]